MKISELKPGMRRVDIEAHVVSMDQPREVQTKFGPGQVATVHLKDDSGEVDLTLWNEHIGKVHVGSNVTVQNGYVDSFRGELQLNVGRYGKLEVQE